MFAWVQSLDSFFRQARLRYLGLGLLIAWVYGSWFSNGIFAPDSARGVDTLRISLAASAVGFSCSPFVPGGEHLWPRDLFWPHRRWCPRRPCCSS